MQYFISITRRKSQGYSLVEVMLSIGIISIIAAMSYFLMTNLLEGSKQTKLMRDVATLNAALRTYEASGGSLAGVTDPQAAIDRAKRRLTTSAAKQMAGLRGSMVDNRLSVVLQTAAESSSSDARAYWRPDLGKFIIANSGGTGVKEFALNDALASIDYGEENRASSGKFALNDNWVWDYYKQPAGSPTLPTRPTANPNQPELNPGPGTNPLRLDPPNYSRSGGSMPISSYPIVLALINPNIPGTSEILYSTSPGVWQVYTGPITVAPGTQVDAISSTLDPENYEDSTPVQQTYTTTPIQLVSKLTFNKNSLDYTDLLGPLVPGNYTPKTTAQKGRITLTNSNIPAAYQKSDLMLPYYTKNGASPLVSGATAGGPFTNGFPGQDVPLALADWGTGSKITVKSAMKSLNATYFTDSKISSEELNIKKIDLRDVLITSNGDILTLNLQPDFGDTPVGARVYYNLDGTDPGNNNGEPVSGTLYTGPVTMPNSLPNLTVTARLYPPTAYKNWFNTSGAATKSVPVPSNADFYVGGEFYLDSGSTAQSRNIARLRATGAVDPSFDVGKGASLYSLVGVIRAGTSGVMAGGDFESMNNSARPAAVRLSTTGAVDGSFDAKLK